MVSLGTKRIRVENLPVLEAGDFSSDALATAVREETRAAIAAAIPDGYRLLSIEEHVETLVTGFAHHTTLELAGAHKITHKVKHWAIVTCVKGGQLSG